MSHGITSQCPLSHTTVRQSASACMQRVRGAPLDLNWPRLRVWHACDTTLRCAYRMPSVHPTACRQCTLGILSVCPTTCHQCVLRHAVSASYGMPSVHSTACHQCTLRHAISASYGMPSVRPTACHQCALGHAISAPYGMPSMRPTACHQCALRHAVSAPYGMSSVCPAACRQRVIYSRQSASGTVNRDQRHRTCGQYVPSRQLKRRPAIELTAPSGGRMPHRSCRHWAGIGKGSLNLDAKLLCKYGRVWAAMFKSVHAFFIFKLFFMLKRYAQLSADCEYAIPIHWLQLQYCLLDKQGTTVPINFGVGLF